MLMELKRPGVLAPQEWENAFSGKGGVMGYGEKCCRQTVKYAYGFDVCFIGVCDGLSMVILELDPNGKAEWYNPAGANRLLRARGLWVSYENLRRYLYIFMKYALRSYLERSGKAIAA